MRNNGVSKSLTHSGELPHEQVGEKHGLVFSVPSHAVPDNLVESHRVPLYFLYLKAILRPTETNRRKTGSTGR